MLLRVQQCSAVQPSPLAYSKPHLRLCPAVLTWVWTGGGERGECEIKVGGVVGDVKTPNMGDPWLRLSAQVIKKHFTPFKYHSKL